MLAKANGIVLFARARKLPGIALLSVILILLMVLARSMSIHLPAADGEALTVPLRFMIPLLLAVITCGCVHGRLGVLDGMYYHSQEKPQILLLGGVTLITAALMGILQAVALEPAEAFLVVRNYLGFLGIGLVSGRLIGWQFCWALPLLSLFPLTYFPRNADGDLNWWVFIVAPPGDLTSWIVVVFLLISGAIAVALSPWRLFQIKGLFRTNRM